MQLRTDESMRSSHADGTEIDGLSAVVKEKTAIAKELHAEVNDAVQEVKSLNEELQLNMDASKTQKNRTYEEHVCKDRVAPKA